MELSELSKLRETERNFLLQVLKHKEDFYKKKDVEKLKWALSRFEAMKNGLSETGKNIAVTIAEEIRSAIDELEEDKDG